MGQAKDSLCDFKNVVSKPYASLAFECLREVIICLTADSDISLVLKMGILSSMRTVGVVTGGMH